MGEMASSARTACGETEGAIVPGAQAESRGHFGSIEEPAERLGVTGLRMTLAARDRDKSRRHLHPFPPRASMHLVPTTTRPTGARRGLAQAAGISHATGGPVRRDGRRNRRISGSPMSQKHAAVVPRFGAGTFGPVQSPLYCPE